MNIKLKIILFLGSALFLIFILNMIKKKKLDSKYALTWIMTSIVFIILCIFPRLLNIISELCSIKEPVNALFLLILFLILNLTFTLSIALSQSLHRIKILTQEIGIIKLEVEDLKNDILLDEKNKGKCDNISR